MKDNYSLDPLHTLRQPERKQKKGKNRPKRAKYDNPFGQDTLKEFEY